MCFTVKGNAVLGNYVENKQTNKHIKKPKSFHLMSEDRHYMIATAALDEKCYSCAYTYFSLQAFAPVRA